MLQTQAFVPSFQLYGEPGQTGLPDLVHIEDLVDRSRLHDWNIKPHRHSGLLQIFAFRTVDVAIQWEAREQSLNRPAILMIPPGVVHGFRFSPKIEGTVTTIPTELLQTLSSRPMEATLPVTVPETSAAYDPIGAFLDQLEDEYQGRRPGRDNAIRALIDLCLTWIDRSSVARSSRMSNATHPTRPEKRLAAFLELVEENYTRVSLPSDYASRIGISKAQLTRDCRALDGRTPQQIIHDRLLKEAHRKLAYTRWPIARISDGLGFSDVGYFSRFYKQKTGETPSRYRARIAARMITDSQGG